MEQTGPVKFFNRGPSPVVRLVFFSLLSVLLLFVDARHRYLDSARGALSTLIYPLQRIAVLPSELWQDMDTFFTTRNTLQADNARLRSQHAQDAVQLLQLRGLEAENSHLRSLLDMRARLKLPMRLAEVIYAERDPSHHEVTINLGDGQVKAGQAVLDETGVVGQVTRVLPLESEVTLITDKDHEIPVQVVRNGLRMILYGSGETDEMDLRYTPITADIREGDLLVSSGLGGTYPPGLPVARITRVERDPAFPFAHVECTPVAGVNNSHFLFVLESTKRLPPPANGKSIPRRHQHPGGTP